MITGASTGIGRHAAEYLASLGFHVVATVRKTADMDAISGMGISTLIPIVMDVTSSESVSAAVQSINAITTSLGLPLVALVNNAGVASRSCPVEALEETELRRVMETNFFGMFAITKALLPQLRTSKGRVIMISSLAGLVSLQLGSAYSSSKFAVEALSDSLRREVGALGVSVSVIEPGWVKSSILDNAKANTDDVDVHVVYQKMRESYVAMSAKGMAEADSATVTSKAIHDALVNPRPKTRYLPTKDGAVFPFLAFLSDRVKDTLTARI